MDLPDFKTDRVLPDRVTSNWDRIAPFAFGLGIVATGALMSRFRPSVLDMPSATPRRAEPRHRAARAVARVRDGADHVAPDNMSSKLGKSLVMAGAAMLVARVLDELVSD
ncbi:hypothetical protein [Pseudooceanicola onchidii]|uniref:hypothetical protein n=1 Tax=Pseudooceanicola onchidii TaxID=2562279 RepID=UPI0010AAE801|nr:hypothetical protein [Pseudooceanicola onchidii]